jgi:hypothetical protein
MKRYMSAMHHCFGQCEGRRNYNIVIVCVTHDGHPYSTNRPPIRMILDGNEVSFFKKTKTICDINLKYFFEYTRGSLFLFVERMKLFNSKSNIIQMYKHLKLYRYFKFRNSINLLFLIT